MHRMCLQAILLLNERENNPRKDCLHECSKRGRSIVVQIFQPHVLYAALFGGKGLNLRMQRGLKLKREGVILTLNWLWGCCAIPVAFSVSQEWFNWRSKTQESSNPTSVKEHSWNSESILENKKCVYMCVRVLVCVRVYVRACVCVCAYTNGILEESK